MGVTPYISDLLIQRSVEQCVPISVMLELTHGCNLQCRHCYLTGEVASREPELSTGEVISLMDQLADMGTLYLSLTGGEPLLRSDMWAIVLAAAERGFASRLFTNGTLLDEEWASRLGRLGTVSVDVSLHGATGESHDRMTCSAGSFDRAVAAMERLRSQGVPTTAKVPLTRLNAAERRAMREMVDRLGAEVIFDPVVSARNCGARDTLCLRLEHDELVDLYRSEGAAAPVAGPAELTCTAGVNSASVTPDGVVRPCVQLLLDCGRLRERGFAEIWIGSPTLKMLRQLADNDILSCSSCPRRELCNRCPGLALLEDGDLLGPSSAACQVALARGEAMGVGVEG